MSFRKKSRPARVLLVDDNPGDILLMQEGLAMVDTPIDCTVAVDGEDALAQLRVAAAERLLPDLVLADINMPRMTGLEMLSEMRADQALLHVPVVMMTSSTAAQDVMAAYAGHANSYLSKPLDAMEFFDAMRGLERFWLVLAELPQD